MRERVQVLSSYLLFFFNDTATTEIYTLSLHDALPILLGERFATRECLAAVHRDVDRDRFRGGLLALLQVQAQLLELLLQRSEEHTSELQSRQYLVCRLLLEKKKNNDSVIPNTTTPSAQ